VNTLIDRQYWTFVLDSIVMSFLVLLKIKSKTHVYREFEKFYFRISMKHPKLAQVEELMLLEMFLQYWEDSKAKGMNFEIAQAFQTKLCLFDWEKALIRQLLTQIDSTESPGTISPIQQGVHQVPGGDDDDPLLNQQIVVLTQELALKKDTFTELKKKRSKMIRTYYQGIVDNLQQAQFMSAAKQYIKLAKRMARRRDFESSSLMVLLSLLARLKGNQTTAEVKTQIDSVLNKLGIVEKILNDQFSVKLGSLTLDILNSRNPTMLHHLEEMLSCLPLLPQEAVLTKLEFR
ncbi:MAG: hypothetical protein KAR20_25200, partial [Candidatus Heimdallarchaeota archaeon]|nr:hypothetical protein [Candidatus Heimdallarchaeota archaeon]